MYMLIFVQLPILCLCICKYVTRVCMHQVVLDSIASAHCCCHHLRHYNDH